MDIDYKKIGKRIARRRKELGLKQSQLSEKVGISDPYMLTSVEGMEVAHSNIECATSIPSTEVIMRLALALDTTPDEFLVGTARQGEEGWKDIAELLRPMKGKQLDLAKNFLTWLSEQDLEQ